MLFRQVLVGLLLFLFVLEIGLRILNPAFLASGYQDLNGTSSKLFQDDDFLGWKYKPDKIVRYFGPEYDITLRTSFLGFRDLDVKGDWVFTGDSFTLGCCVEQNESFAELSGSLIGKTVLNLGVEGYGTDQAYWSYQAAGINASPSVVFYAFYVNDLDDNVNANTKPAYALNDGNLKKVNYPVRRSFVSSAKVSLYESSYAFRVFIQVLERVPVLKGFLSDVLRFRISDAFSRFFAPGSGVPSEVQSLTFPLLPERETRLQITEAIIAKYAKDVKSHGSDFVLVLLPSKLQTNFQNTTVRAQESFNVTLYPSVLFQRMERLAAIQGFKVVNLLPDFEQSVKKGEKPYFEFDGHLTREGHALAAKRIADSLKT